MADAKDPKEYLIVALDVQSKKEALEIVNKLRSDVSYFKVGLTLFAGEGPKIIDEIKKLGCKVFLDGKFLDIPHQVSGAVSSLVHHKVDMMNVHLTGGMHMLYDAKQAIITTSKKLNIEPPKLLGVTALTSINEEILQENLQIKAQIDEYVLNRAKIAKEAGLDGIVCSPKEASLVRKELGKDFLIVTPGVRPKWAEKNDQKRTSTPKEAVKNGANFVVVGRPITDAKDPLDAARKILSEIKEGIS